MGLLQRLKALWKGDGGEGGIDAIRADQQATLTYGIPPDQAERTSRRDAEELERAEAEDK